MTREEQKIFLKGMFEIVSNLESDVLRLASVRIMAASMLTNIEEIEDDESFPETEDQK